MSKQKIVVLTGAGISAESGISTFRDAGGLWEGYDINEVATPAGWQKNQALVLEFYNQRRKNVRSSKPNAAHYSLVDLEEKYNVQIITQNIDDLHERAGSTNVLHLHGEIMKARSSRYEHLLYDLEDKDIAIGDHCEKGFQLRPHVVWFGEAVPMMEKAIMEASTADILMVIGTSLVVYPAAGLVNYVPRDIPKYIIDPNIPDGLHHKNLVRIPRKAGEGVPDLVNKLMQVHALMC
jgi:NAD-dependent deacetylase